MKLLELIQFDNNWGLVTNGHDTDTLIYISSSDTFI